jgi:hypothetical protein
LIPDFFGEAADTDVITTATAAAIKPRSRKRLTTVNLPIVEAPCGEPTLTHEL